MLQIVGTCRVICTLKVSEEGQITTYCIMSICALSLALNFFFKEQNAGSWAFTTV